MQRIDGAYLYEFGAIMRPVLNLPEENTKRVNLWVALHSAKKALSDSLYRSVYSGSFKTLVNPGVLLLNEISEWVPDDLSGVASDWWTEEVVYWQFSSVKEHFKRFEAVLIAELQMAALYHVSAKGGYETLSLTDNGEHLFPTDLADKVPTALVDVKAAARCIAFNLPTAAGFHLHRANEGVLRVYWDVVTDNSPRPAEGNMGVYLRELNQRNKGKKEVREHLKSIKDFHRNPLMHPESNFETIDEAIDLLSAIRCSIGYMLSEIPKTPALIPAH